MDFEKICFDGFSALRASIKYTGGIESTQENAF